MISVTGSITALLRVFITPQATSLPFMKASIRTSSLSLKAFSKADARSSFFLTLVTPKLDPLSLGFTKQGIPTLLITASISTSSPSLIITALAMGIL